LTDIDIAVAALLAAWRLGTTVPVPPSPDAAADYAVQAGVADALGWFADGPPRYWRESGVAAAMALLRSTAVPAARAPV